MTDGNKNVSREKREHSRELKKVQNREKHSNIEEPIIQCLTDFGNKS